MWCGAVAADGRDVARWAFSDAHSGGLSAAGRTELAAALGLLPTEICWPGVCHSADIGVVDEPIQLLPAVDGLVTRLRGVGLATLGADCVPLIAVAPRARVVLSAHVGWRGAADGIADAILSALSTEGAAITDTTIWLGPAICGECYQVDEARRTAVAAVLPASATAGGVDLRRGLQHFFADRGANIELIGGCTFEADPELHSFRRNGTAARQTAAVVLL